MTIGRKRSAPNAKSVFRVGVAVFVLAIPHA
jgi:hypothetical protein